MWDSAVSPGGALAYSRLPPSWWKEQILESVQPCLSSLANIELLCSSALAHGAAMALDFTLVVFVRFASCFVVAHVDACCAVWSPVFTAVFYEFSQGFIDGSFLFVIRASIWFYNMTTWVTFCGNCDVHLLEAWSRYLLCCFCCWSATKTKNLRTPPKTKNYFQFKSKTQAVFHKAINYWVLFLPFAPWIKRCWYPSECVLLFVIIIYNTNDSHPLGSIDILGLPRSFIHNVTIRECCYCFFISVLHLLT